VRVRLEGIDAPESGQTCTGAERAAWSCGAAATKYAAELAGGHVVECVVIGLDKYRRLLGTCSVLDATGKPDGPTLNERMVATGLAVALYSGFPKPMSAFQQRRRNSAPRENRSGSFGDSRAQSTGDDLIVAHTLETLRLPIELQSSRVRGEDTLIRGRSDGFVELKAWPSTSTTARTQNHCIRAHIREQPATALRAPSPSHLRVRIASQDCGKDGGTPFKDRRKMHKESLSAP
jgi:hypothetical protein